MAAVGLVVAIAAATMAVRAVGAAGCSGVCKSFVNSGLDGGSYITTIAVDPSGSGVVLAGSDVGGVYRSTDLGQSWLPANTGITLGALSVASLVFSPGSPGKVYAALGNLGPGGVEVSADGGQTWTARSSVPRFNVPNRYTGARPSGKVLATSSAGYLYAATSDQGILRSADEGATWTGIGLNTGGAVLRSIVVDPRDPAVVYVGNYGTGNSAYPAGLYESTDATSPTPTFAPVAGAPGDVEDLAIVGGTLYAVASSSGVFASTDRGSSWRPLLPGGPLWASLDGYAPPGGADSVLFAGAARPARNSAGGYDSVVRSIDGGLTWSSVTSTPLSVHTTEGGPTGSPWWFATAQPGMLLGAGSYIPRQIAINPAQPTNVFVAGRADIWSTPDGGADWYPMVHGLGTTVERGVVADPAGGGRVYAIGYDWDLVSSSDGLSHVVSTPAPGSSASLAIALDTSTTPSTVFLAAFNEASPATTTEVYSNRDPISGQPWTSLSLAAATGGKPVLGLSVKTFPFDGGSVPVVLAAVGMTSPTACAGRCGIWRRVGTGAWTQVSRVAMSGGEGASHVSVVWAPGSATVYLYDPATGLWRSSDAGGTWTQIWAHAYNHDLTGYLAARAQEPSSVYLSLGTQGLFRLSGAATGRAVGDGILAQVVGSFSGAGPIAAGPDGSLWVAQVAPYGSGLWTSADGARTWTAVDDAVYRSAADYPTDVSIGNDGSVYVATKGDGVLVGR